MSDRVGIVGTGVLGRGIVERMLERGVEVAVFDPNPAAVEGLAERGARVCESNLELARHSDLVGVLVRDDAQCIAALTGSEGVLVGLASGSAIAIHSTVHPDTIEQLAERAAEAGVALVDAPVAGQGTKSLAAGDFWMLVGGDEAVAERLREPASTFCEQVLHCGPLGSGAALKLSHNVAAYISYLAILEANALARVAGVKPGLVEQVTQASGALSDAMKLIADTHRLRDLQPSLDPGEERVQGYVGILEKDLRVAREVGRAHGLELPGAGVAMERARFIYGLDS